MNIATVVELESAKVNELVSQDYLPQTRHLRALEEIKEMDEFGSVLDGVKGDEIRLGSENVKLGRFQERNGKVEVIPYRFRFLRRRQPWMEKLSRFPCVLWLLAEATDSIGDLIGHDEFEDIGDELRSLKRPWDGVEELGRNYLDLDLSPWSRVYFLVKAPFPIRFGKGGTLSDGNLEFSIEMAKVVEMNQINVSAITYPQTGFMNRQMIDIGKPIVDKRGLLNTAEIVRNLKEATYAKLFLTYGGVFVDSVELYSPLVESEDPRVRSYEVFDNDLGVLQKQLSGAGSVPSEDFEKGVASLLHLLGLSVIRLMSPIEREIDILAVIPDESTILAAECTLENVKNKTGTVSTRANKVAAAVSGYQVIPSVWTCLSGTEIPQTEREAAAKDKVALITREIIKELLENVKTARVPENISKYFLSLVSSSLF